VQGTEGDRAHPLVLVADASHDVRAALRCELEVAGYRVVDSADGRQVLDDAACHEPSVILLDVEMPVLDGHATLAALKRDPRTADVPVVFLSGRGAGEDLVQALREGAHDYLRKPPEPAELLARVGAANRMKELQDELRRRAAQLDLVSRTDHLTGLANRRHVEEHLRVVLAAAVRHTQPAAVLLADIDDFKAVNDSRGHAAGDEVLLRVARALAESVRIEDEVGRWGGDEFIIVAPHTDAAAATVLAERLRQAVSNTTEVTLSIGGAATSTAGSHPFEVADANLYEAKAAGRNRVVITTADEAVV
jgi:two-component system cell cycle response regulator